MSKRKCKRRLDRESYLARKKLKAEIRARHIRPTSLELGVTIIPMPSPLADDIWMPLSLISSLMMRSRIKRSQDFYSLPRRKRL